MDVLLGPPLRRNAGERRGLRKPAPGLLFGFCEFSPVPLQARAEDGREKPEQVDRRSRRGGLLGKKLFKQAFQLDLPRLQFG